MKRYKTLAHWPARLAATASLLAGSWMFTTAPSRAADKYDQDLERRVQTLERELNIMEGDKKGKNVEESEVPTYLRAGSKNVKELVITGEVRFRYEYDNATSQPPNPPGGGVPSLTHDVNAQTSRERFRFRLFADYKLTDNFYFGAAIQTAQAADSGNTTFSEGFDNYSLYLWRFFLGYKPTDNITLTIGKMPNPFYSNTELLIDADISPTGLAQQVKIPISTQFEIQLNSGEFIFNDNNENAVSNPSATLPNPVVGGAPIPNPAYSRKGNSNTDAYLLYSQVVATYKPVNDIAVTLAGGFLSYVGGGTANPALTSNGVSTFNFAGAGNGVGQNGNVLGNTAAFNSSNSSRNLLLGTFSNDVKLGFGAFKVKAYADAVYNFHGGARDREEYGAPFGRFDGIQDKVAFATGVTFGSDYTLKKKGDYLLLAEYRQVGLGSVDPNLNDSDFNGSRLGFRGFKGAVSYAIYPWLFGTVTGYYCNNIGREKDVNLGIANFSNSQTIQVDLTAKF